MLLEFSVGDLKGLGNSIGVYVDVVIVRYVKLVVGFVIIENKIIGRGLIINNG